MGRTVGGRQGRLTGNNMSKIEKATATCARLKGHLTRAKNMLAKELEAIKSPHVIENAFDEAKMKFKKS